MKIDLFINIYQRNQSTQRFMENDMRKALLNKKSGAFDKQFEQCLLKVQKMKQKNDFMQKQVGTDGQETIRREVTKHEQFIEKQVKQLKSLMESMDKNYKDPESKNKLRTLKADAQKQIERNKTIMREFINKSFLKLSRGALNQQQDASRYMEGGKVSYKHFGDDKKGQTSPRKRQTEQDQQNKMKPDSLLTDQYMDMNFQVERKMLQQKKALLDEVEQTSYRVNQIINDMAIMVDEQGQNLDIISEELMKSNKNLVLTNQELDQASKLQRKSRKKYIVFAIILIALIGAGVGFFFFIN